MGCRTRHPNASRSPNARRSPSRPTKTMDWTDREAAMSYLTDLDSPLLRLSDHDHFTLRAAVAGVHSFGGIVSGKSSGLSKTQARANHRARKGGIVMTAKFDEVAL